jgi:MOSC domain-containing protein YiiM
MGERNAARGTVLAVSVGGVRDFDFKGRSAQSAIWKTPVSGRVMARGVNLEGDDQADREAHGGPDKAIYAYAIEDYRWWQKELGRPLEHAEFGENLTTVGIDVTGALVGDRWRVGNALLEVSEPRVPCWRLGVRMDDPTFARRFTEAGRPGTYLRIIEEGDIGADDAIDVVDRPAHDVSIGAVFRIYTRDRHEAVRLLGVDKISDAWKQWAEKAAGKAARSTAGPGCC